MKRIKSGQSLIEIVVAVGIISVVLVGVSDLITRSLNLATFQAKKSTAVNLAQDQLNYFSKVRDLGPKAFFEDYSTDPTYKTCVNVPTSVKSCTITYTRIPPAGQITGVDMKVDVVWTNGDQEITTSLSKTIANPSK